MLRNFETEAQWPFTELPEAVWVWLVKILGAVLGSAISIVYVLPRGRREAAIRFAVGLTIGIVFGPTLGAKLADYLELAQEISRIETILMGATIASLCAWWGLGVVRGFLQSKDYSASTKK